MDSLKVLDLERPIREADIARYPNAGADQCAFLRISAPSAQQVDVPDCLDRLFCARTVPIIPILLTGRRATSGSVHPTDAEAAYRRADGFCRPDGLNPPDQIGAWQPLDAPSRDDVHPIVIGSYRSS
jgi:hypothetical protein